MPKLDSDLKNFLKNNPNKQFKQNLNTVYQPGAQPGFCQEGGLKMEKFCDVILMTYFRWRNL